MEEMFKNFVCCPSGLMRSALNQLLILKLTRSDKAGVNGLVVESERFREFGLSIQFS